MDQPYARATAPSRQAQIPEQLERIDRNISRLAELAHRLGDRVLPVRRQAPKIAASPSNGSKEPSDLAPYAMALAGNNAMLASLADYLDNVLEELEV